jgi:hypothetical protein
VVVVRRGEGEIVAIYKKFLFKERQKRPLIIETKISSFGFTFLGQHSLI